MISKKSFTMIKVNSRVIYMTYVPLQISCRTSVLMAALGQKVRVGDFLDLDPPNNPPSHYVTCHFGYNLALKEGCTIFEVEHISFNFLGF